MAKGLRSSIKKAHRTTLRARVFQPVENERAERIHAKLLEIVQQPKPEAPKKSEMEVDTEDAAASEEQKDDNAPQEMEVDGLAASTNVVSNPRKGKFDKKTKRKTAKPRNAIAFPKSRGKGALKPFSDNKNRKSTRK